jgi:phage gpG-like protein
MGASIDLAKLAKLKGGLKALSKPGQRNALWSRVNNAIAKEALHQVHECFTHQRAPNGRSWKPLQSRAGIPLRDSGLLFNSIDVQMNTKGFELFSLAKYARVQNFGAVIVPKTATALRFKVRGKWVFAKKVTVPARPFFPDDKLPQRWARAFREQAGLATEAYLREVGLLS